MKNIFLIRHGEPDFPGGKKLCLGRTELPLSQEGRRQAACAAAALRDRELQVFSSPLIRARQTAEALGRPVHILQGLQEIYAGLWDGLSFEQIKRDWPELYAARGMDKSLQPPGAEDRGEALRRFKEALSQACRAAPGDIALISHGGIMELFLQSLGSDTGKPGYCQIIRLACSEEKIYITGGNNNA